MLDLLGNLRVQIAGFDPCDRAVPFTPDPDVVLVADTMPVMPASELVTRTRATLDPQIGVPLIVLTTTAAADRRAALLDAGADDCLSMPVAVTELRARVARLVRGRGRIQWFERPPQPANVAQRTLRREGEYWTIGYLGETLRLRDCKGLQHLARLLAHPHSEVYALMLTAPAADAVSERVAASATGAADRGRNGPGDAHPIRDARAKGAYRRRLEQLNELRDEARRFDDHARIAQIETEMEALARELEAAAGSGGGDRRAAASAERARINVTRTIKAAIDAIAAHHRPLGQHLRAAVRTGTFSCYAPLPGTNAAWRVG